MTKKRRREQAVPVRSCDEPIMEVQHFVPDADIYETNDVLIVVADLDGVSPGAPDVTLHEKVLAVRRRTRRLIGAEYELEDSYWAFTIPEKIDNDRIEASLHDGVRSRRLVKGGTARVVRIPIEAD